MDRCRRRSVSDRGQGQRRVAVDLLRPRPRSEVTMRNIEAVLRIARELGRRVRPVAALAIGACRGRRGQQRRPRAPKFYDDDPISREPETQDASGAASRDIGLFYSLTYNLFVTARRPPATTRAGNLNTIDEVPDSSWFTNRIGARPITPSEIAARRQRRSAARARRGGSIIREKSAGFAPGFTASRCQRRDVVRLASIRRRIPKVRPRPWSSRPSCSGRSATTRSRRSSPRSIRIDWSIDPTATARRPSGKRTPFAQSDLRRGPRARGAQRRTAPTGSPPAVCCPARSSADSSTHGHTPR